MHKKQPQMKADLYIIAAVAQNGVIGRAGSLPWNLPNDLHRFKQLTSGHVLVMGRRTWQSVSRPLPDRITVVVSHQKPDNVCEGVYYAGSFEEAVSLAQKEFPDKKIFVCGGAQIYKDALPYVSCMHLTRIQCSVEGDTFFPEFNQEDFEEIILESVTDEQLPYSFIDYVRRK